MQSGHQRASMLADAFEAIAAALLLDAGSEFAWSWLYEIFKQDIHLGNDILQKFDAKSRFQQWIQSLVGTPPVYRVIGTESTPEKTEFIVGAFVGRTEVARASAPNKRVASKIVAQRLVDMVDSGELTPEMVKLYFEEGKL
jgi:ribonuclease-3